jgi:hypothetical protein
MKTKTITAFILIAACVLAHTLFAARIVAPSEAGGSATALPDRGKVFKLVGAEVYARSLIVPVESGEDFIVQWFEEVPAAMLPRTASAEERSAQAVAALVERVRQSGTEASTAVVPWEARQIVLAGDLRSYQTGTFSAIQPHTTQIGWEPPRVPALWKLEATASTDGTPPAWVQPTGGHDVYARDALVLYSGTVWRSKVDGNVWPPAEGALWTSGTTK